MACGTHTSCPSSTSEWSGMATRGALRRRPRSLVAHRWVTAVSSPSGELALAALELDPTGRARRPRGSSTPPAAHRPGGARPHSTRRRPRVLTARGNSGRGSSTPPERADLGELDPTHHAADLRCRPREAAVAWPPASFDSGWVGSGG
jgi:hypothetical protein